MARNVGSAEGRDIAKARNTRMACLIPAAAALILAGVMFSQYLLSDDRARLSRDNCLLVLARVVNKGKSLEERAGMQFPVHLVRYAFSFSGRRVEGRGRVSREWYNWLERGGEVEVYVDTADPQRNFLKLEYTHRVGRILRTGCIAAAIGAALAVCGLFPGAARKMLVMARMSTRG